MKGKTMQSTKLKSILCATFHLGNQRRFVSYETSIYYKTV